MQTLRKDTPVKDPFLPNDKPQLSEMVLADAVFEKARQIEKWGLQSHQISDWLAILGEEVGECSKAYLEYKFNGDRRKELYKELIQTATVALNIADALREVILVERKKP
jgi:NTP pyrophosphatase (non-canonical NTP hydrolase)